MNILSSLWKNVKSSICLLPQDPMMSCHYRLYTCLVIVVGVLKTWCGNVNLRLRLVLQPGWQKPWRSLGWLGGNSLCTCKRCTLTSRGAVSIQFGCENGICRYSWQVRYFMVLHDIKWYVRYCMVLILYIVDTGPSEHYVGVKSSLRSWWTRF